MHLLSKMAPVVNGQGGSRFGIVLNGSPLFTGGAGSGDQNVHAESIEPRSVWCSLGRA